VRQPAALAELVVEIGKLLLTRQRALEQKPGGFLEAALASERLDGDAAVLQAGTLAVDEADRRLGGRHVRQTRSQLQHAHGESLTIYTGRLAQYPSGAVQGIIESLSRVGR